MRTPNCKCIICKKPLYRRPFELKKYKFVCCISCRGEAYKKYPSENAIKNLELGREKGTNHLEGHIKSKETKDKIGQANKEWWSTHPDELMERGKKMRAEKHYNWKGGITKLNKSIRQMTENRKWMDSVKERDRKCVKCDSEENLESHHKISIQKIIKIFEIKNRQDARMCLLLWDIDNGETLCQKCHYKIHRRNYDNRRNCLQ